ncbi:hypothetical protein [Metabacillus litoralis]|uniref:hypothetical protein n=1 Tax=Metabacillus litoralis TaxID=152268 RepID=UPI00288AD547|nr:hypothetical protein [Metabacillus litoralis]
MAIKEEIEIIQKYWIVKGPTCKASYINRDLLNDYIPSYLSMDFTIGQCIIGKFQILDKDNDE